MIFYTVFMRWGRCLLCHFPWHFVVEMFLRGQLFLFLVDGESDEKSLLEKSPASMDIYIYKVVKVLLCNANVTILNILYWCSFVNEVRFVCALCKFCDFLCVPSKARHVHISLINYFILFYMVTLHGLSFCSIKASMRGVSSIGKVVWKLKIQSCVQ